MISFDNKGDFSKSFNFLNNIKTLNIRNLSSLAEKGVIALTNASPMDSGLMKHSWNYNIEQKNGVVTINWTNSDIEGGCNVAILVQYGHGTKDGKYVKGVDFINPALKPIFDEIANDVWKEVNK